MVGASSSPQTPHSLSHQESSPRCEINANLALSQVENCGTEARSFMNMWSCNKLILFLIDPFNSEGNIFQVAAKYLHTIVILVWKEEEEEEESVRLPKE